jgi:hypothetical protein
MKVGSVLILLIALIVSFTFAARAQDKKSAAETADELRTQLQEVQAKEAELQARLKQLDEDLKPENIERFFAGVGSTRPEDQLSGRRARLESSILNADAAAYQQSAQGDASQPEQLMAAQAPGSPRWLVAVAGFVAVLGVGSLIAVVRRMRKS